MPRQKPPGIPLPKGWPSHVKSGVLHIISLAHFSITHARGWAAKSVSARVRIAAEKDRLHQEIALLREELRIKDARMSVIAPHRRPRCAPTEASVDSFHTLLLHVSETESTRRRLARFRRTRNAGGDALPETLQAEFPNPVLDVFEVEPIIGGPENASRILELAL